MILPEPTADMLSNLGSLASSPTASPAGRPAPFLGGSLVFRGLFAALVSVSAGPPAGGRATTCFSDCGAVLFDFFLRICQYFPVCWCRSPTSTIEAPVSVDTLAPDSLSQQVYSRVRQSLAGAIAQPRPCGHLGIRPSRHTDKPTLVQRRGRALFVWKIVSCTSLTWLRPRRPCCLQDLAQKKQQKRGPSRATFPT